MKNVIFTKTRTICYCGYGDPGRGVAGRGAAGSGISVSFGI